MVREGRVFIATGAIPAFGSTYSVQALEVGAQVASGSAGTTVTVRAGHGFAATDKFIVGTDTSKYRTVQSATSTTLTIDSAVSVSAGDLLVNLAADTGTTSPNYDGAGLTIYTDMDYSTSAASNTVQTDANGKYRYFHKGIAIWELVRAASVGPIAVYVDAAQVQASDVNARYMNQFATGGDGSATYPWTGWESAAVEGYTLRFRAGYYSASTLVIPVTTTNAASKTAVVGDSAANTFLTITGGTGQLRIYGSGAGTRVLQSVKVSGLTVYAGANNTSTGLVSLENFDIGCVVDDLVIDPTASFYTTVGLNYLNGEQTTFGSVCIRGWSSVDAAAGNVRTGLKISTDSGLQAGNLNFDSVQITNVTTGMSISTSGGSYAGVNFSTFKVINSTLVDGTTGISLASNAEQISFDNLHLERLNTGLTATSVESITIANGLASLIKNNAASAGNAINIVNGDGGRIFCRVGSSYNGIVLSGTTTRYLVQQATSDTIAGAYFTDSSSGLNTYLSGQTIVNPTSVTGLLTVNGGITLAALGSVVTIATDAITVTKSSHQIDTEGSAAFDLLSTINGGSDGQLLSLTVNNDGRQVLVSNGVGNIFLGGNGNRLLGNSLDVLVLRKLGSNWNEVSYSSTRGHSNCNAEEITLSTSGLTTDSSANLLPASSLIDAVAARVTVTITTTTNWAVGDGTTSARFSSANATLTSGTTSVGFNHMQGSISTDATGPVQTAAAKIRITCTGANPGAGKIRIFVFYRQFQAPSA